MSLWIEREFVEEETEEDVGKFLGTLDETSYIGSHISIGTLDETLEVEPLEGGIGWKIG